MPAKFDNNILNTVKDQYSIKGPLALSKELNVNEKTIHRWARKLDLPKLKNPPKPKVEVSCVVCGISFKIGYYYFNSKIKLGKTTFCCKKYCASIKATWRGLSEKALELAKQGKTNKEISEILNKPPGTIGSWLNKKKYRRYASGGKSYSSIKNKLLKEYYHKCQICDFSRAIEVAHIVPACQGGELSFENTLGLCPNHHYLFDRKNLTVQEAENLKEKVKNYMEYVNVPGPL